MNDNQDYQQPGRIATVKFGNPNNKQSSVQFTNNLVSISDHSLRPDSFTNHHRQDSAASLVS